MEKGRLMVSPEFLGLRVRKPLEGGGGGGRCRAGRETELDFLGVDMVGK